MKRILLGTTNPSKGKRFRDLLREYAVEFYTLADLGITDEPAETGKTPEENAGIKARYYGRYFDAVICNDSGLYFDGLPLDDPRQPGLNIRAPQGRRLDDEEMISYYSGLIRSLGGRVSAYYLDGIAVFYAGKTTTFMGKDTARQSAFVMVDTPSQTRHPGWPLDSISINKNTGTYFTESGDNKYDTDDENIMVGRYRQRLTAFLAEALGLERL